MPLDFRQLLREERARAQQKASVTTPVDGNNTHKHTPSESQKPATQEPLDTWRQRDRLENLDAFRVGPIATICYLPHWINANEEAAIRASVYAQEPSRWVTLKQRRLQMWGGIVQTPFVPAPLPVWLQQLSDALVACGIFPSTHAPNHVLINEYGPNDGIMPHQDGPSYYPLVAILSTSANAHMTFQPHRAVADATDTTYTLQVERCSLLVFTEEAYTKYLHSIANVHGGTRVSLTIRHVL